MKGRTSANSIFRVLHEHSTRQETASRRGWGVTPPSLRHDIPMAESFLAALDPDADRFTFQLFSDGDADYARIIHGNIHELWPTVEKLNVPERQVGVFVTVNATDFKGRRRENIVRARALFVDADGEQQVGKCIDAIKASRATPSLIVRTSAHAAHFYWLCDDLAPETFEFYQQALIDRLGTDPAAKDLSRVMRLPGTLHLKQAANPWLVCLIGQGQRRRWKIDELVAKLSLPLFDGRRVRDNVVYPEFERRGANESTAADDPEIDKIRSAVDAIPTSILASENDWVRIARGLAHQASISEPHAEKLWAILDEASRKALNYDANENRRRWERYIREAPQRQHPITIATVFAQARSAGWQPATGEAPDTEISVLYVPGNEEVCRRALDQIVAADERVFTLEGSGLLSILRAPERETQSPGIQWEGDLPGTTLATVADVMERAERLTWKRPGKNGIPRRVHPPQGFVGNWLQQMRGRYAARELRGIARVPRIDDDGQIHFALGYDPATRLYQDNTPVFEVPASPSRADALKASKALLLPFSEYQFENPATAEAMVLGMVLTAVERPYLPTAPMLIIRSSMAGTGKGLLVRSLVQLSYDTSPVVATWGATPEETEKRIAALLLQSPAAICIDNANGKMIHGDLLESIITEGRADIRILGRSEIVRVHNSASRCHYSLRHHERASASWHGKSGAPLAAGGGRSGMMGCGMMGGGMMGHGMMGAGACQVVEGRISPMGYCGLYVPA
jgi:hypothetical protein